MCMFMCVCTVCVMWFEISYIIPQTFINSTLRANEISKAEAIKSAQNGVCIMAAGTSDCTNTAFSYLDAAH